MHAARLPGPALQAPAPDKARLVQSLGRDAARALEGLSQREEAARFAGAARAAAAVSLLLVVLALVVAGVGIARAETSTGALEAGTIAALVAALGLMPLALRRAAEKARLVEAVAALRQRLAAALRGAYERELNLGQKRVQEATLPYARFVRAEGERLRGQSQDLATRKRELDALRAPIAGLR